MVSWSLWNLKTCKINSINVLKYCQSQIYLRTWTRNFKMKSIWNSLSAFDFLFCVSFSHLLHIPFKFSQLELLSPPPALPDNVWSAWQAFLMASDSDTYNTGQVSLLLCLGHVSEHHDTVFVKFWAEFITKCITVFIKSAFY